MDALSLPVRLAIGCSQLNAMAAAYDSIERLRASQVIADRVYARKSGGRVVVSENSSMISRARVRARASGVWPTAESFVTDRTPPQRELFNWFPNLVHHIRR